MVSDKRFLEALRTPDVIGEFNRRLAEVIETIDSFSGFQYVLEEINGLEARIKSTHRLRLPGHLSDRKYGRLINMCNKNRSKLMRYAKSKMIKEKVNE